MKTTGFLVLACSVLYVVPVMAERTSDAARKVVAAASQEIRQPGAAGSGDDVCMKWNLSEADLESCRHQWADAKTETDRLAIRDHYTADMSPRDDPEQLTRSNFHAER